MDFQESVGVFPSFCLRSSAKDGLSDFYLSPGTPPHAVRNTVSEDCEVKNCSVRGDWLDIFCSERDTENQVMNSGGLHRGTCSIKKEI